MRFKLVGIPWTARIGLSIVALNLFAALFAPLLAPYGPAEIVAGRWSPPGGELLLGADHLGRDMLTRLLYGARTTIGLALICTVLAFVIGVVAGFSAALVGQYVDQVLSRTVDALMAIPTLILALLVISALGTTIPVLIGVITVIEATRVYRLSRAVGMDIAVMDYVEVARLRGEGIWWIITREILPNATPPLLAEFGVRFCFVVLFISALSFLGLGVQPPTADWGGMVRENAPAIQFRIVAPLFPASAIAMLTVGINLVVDWLLGMGGRTIEARKL